MLKFDTQDTVKKLLDNMKTNEDVDAFFMYVSETFPKPELTKQNAAVVRRIIKSNPYMETNAFDLIDDAEITDELWPVVLARQVVRLSNERKFDPQGVPDRPGFGKFHEKWGGVIVDSTSAQ